MALAAHGYIRATEDVDLGVCTLFSPTLQGLRNRLRDLGLDVTLRSPDDDDPLDGVLVVEDGHALVEVVNLRGRLGRAAVDNSENLGEGLRCVRAAELVALKLYAGGRKSNHDVHALLDANSNIDLTEVERTCGALGLASEWADIVEERKSDAQVPASPWANLGPQAVERRERATGSGPTGLDTAGRKCSI